MWNEKRKKKNPESQEEQRKKEGTPPQFLTPLVDAISLIIHIRLKFTVTYPAHYTFITAALFPSAVTWQLRLKRNDFRSHHHITPLLSL